jgi:hypothetical protein
VQDGAFHARHEFDNAGVADVLDEAVDDVVAEIAVGHLPPTETQAGLHLVAAGKELDRLVLLGLVVVLIHSDGELDLLDDNHFLPLLGGAFALFFLVEEAAVVLDAADRRNRVGRDFHQVQAAFAGNLQSFEGGQNSELFAVLVDDADFARTYPVIDADKGLCRTFIECDGTPPDFIAGRIRGSPKSPRSQQRTLSIALARLE